MEDPSRKSENLIDLSAELSRPNDNWNYLMSLYPNQNGSHPQNPPGSNVAFASFSNNYSYREFRPSIDQGFIQNKRQFARSSPSAQFSVLYRPSLQSVRFSSIPESLSSSNFNGMTRSYNSYPDFGSMCNPYRHPPPALEVLRRFEEEKVEKLRKTGDLIDLGTTTLTNTENFDILRLDPLRLLSVSSESSADSPYVNGGEFNSWEKFDDSETTITQERSVDEGISCDQIDSDSSKIAEEPEKESGGKKLTLSQVKSENESLRSFYRMVYRLQRDFQYDDELTNVGFIRAQMVEDFQRNLRGLIKLNVRHKPSNSTISFECDVQTSVDHVISHVLFELKGDEASLMQINRYIFRIHGRMDCLSGESPLADYQHVHSCVKKESPLNLILLDLNDHNEMRRTLEDDQRPFSLDDVARRPKDPSREDISILIDVFEKEVDKFTKVLLECRFEELPYHSVSQSVKAICSKIRSLEPHFLTLAVEKLFIFTHTSCSKENQKCRRASSSTSGITTLQSELNVIICEIRSAIVKLFHLYTSAFRSPFSLQRHRDKAKGRQEMITVLDPVRIYIDSLHNIPPEWKLQYANYYFLCSLVYSQTDLHVAVKSGTIQVTESFFSKLAFEDWIEFRSISICSLPRETKIILSLYGSNISQEEKPGENAGVTPMLIGWISMFIFDCDWDISATATCHLVQGDKILGLWRSEAVVIDGPALSGLNDPSSPLLWVVLPEYDNEVVFPAVLHSSSYAAKKNFDCLAEDVQLRLQDILDRDILQPLSSAEKELIWEKRSYLHSFPGALPRILESAHGWDWASLADIYAMLDNWPQLSPIDAMQLLLNAFPDEEVRRYAVNCIRQSSTEVLSRFLPQLVQAIKLQNYDANALTKFLLESALHNINISHDLYWLLKENIFCPKLGYRFRLILNSLLNLSGNAMRTNFRTQENFISTLTDVAGIVKGSRDSNRNTTLEYALQTTQRFLSENGPVTLPINSAWKVAAIDVEQCCYFPSLNVPIKLSFKSVDEDADLIHVIYKCGDDLRQDQLAMQLIRIMDKMWIQNAVDLRMVTFTVRQTDVRKGFIEAICNAETLRKIQVGHGVTGAFKDKPLASWLLKHNPSETAYRKVDFGKFLGDAQMFGAIKRDRAPFVLTADMVYVINGGDKPTTQFQEFVDLCCQAFNVLRRSGNTLITLFEMMVYSDIAGISRDASKYVQRALMMDLNDAEATASFTRLIEESVKSWFTQFNFFLHNLAQLRFSAENPKGQMLSFASKSFSHRTETKLTNIECFGYQKRFDPQKYYVYIFKVFRENQREPTFVFRSFREVCELYEKLFMMFPLARLHTLSRGVRVGRTNVKNVAQKRLSDVQLFVQSLLAQADDVCHCDLVYTFFHAFPRDANDMQVDKRGIDVVRPVSPSRPPDSPRMRGLVKLSIHYKEDQGLCVLVNHAKDLYSSDMNAPDPYVKTYLYPDKERLTKRKTKVVRKTRHPTFNEMLLYRLPLSDVRYRVLKVTVWNYDRFKENIFLGGVAINLETLDLTKETVAWYTLGSAR